MARYRATVETPRSAEDAFAYMAQFDHTREWDPGVRAAEQATAGPLGLGTRFRLDFAMGPRTTELVYEITAYDPPRAVTLIADSGWLVSHDVIEVTPTATGATIAYDATLTLKGPLRLFDRLLAVGFHRAADKALAGLRRVMAA